VIAASAAGKFFERHRGLRVLGMVTGARRQLAEAERPQLSAQGLLGHRDAELLPQPLHQIDDAPAHDAMDGRGRPVLDDPLQGRAVMRFQDRPLARRRAGHQARGPLRVEAHHPVAHRLQANPADLGRHRARLAGIDRRQRQEPAHLTGIRRRARKPAKGGAS
jgi:hypothetical protein